MRATLVAASERVSKKKKAMGTDPRTGREKRIFCRVATIAACVTCLRRLQFKISKERTIYWTSNPDELK